MRFFILILAFCYPALSISQSLPDSVEYVWPTDASPYLSGTFAETRSEHFHAALDIKTWGQRGYRVFATRDGQLHRVSVGPRGYGKAIYLKHSDGTLSIYAHLLSFEEEIQQLVDSARFTDYSSEIDLVFDSLDIQVNQGDFIAYSGATGIGPPHLHFELRTSSGKPFNPLLTNLSIPDNIPPQFSGLSVEPLAPRTRIEGRNGIYEKQPRRNENSYHFGNIIVDGPVGLGIDVFDLANQVTNAYAVYDLKLILEEELIFHSRVDSFSYDEEGQMFLDRVYPILIESGRAYQRLYKVDGNTTLPFYRETKNQGRLSLPPGNHQLRIVAEDYFGNQSEAHLTLNVQNNDDTSFPDEADGTNENEPVQDISGPEYWSWYSNWVNFNEPDSLNHNVIFMNRETPEIWFRKVHSPSYVELNKTEFTSIQHGDNIFQLYRMLPGEKGKVYGNATRSYASFPANTFYDTLSVGLTEKIYTPDSVRIDFYPQNQPLARGFELTYILNENQKNDSTLAFYTLDKRRGRLAYIPTRQGGTILKGSASQLGTFYVLNDTTAPQIDSPRIFQRADGKWMAMVRAEDNLSGINHHTTEFYVNGTQGIAEFEPEDDRILYYHPDFSPETEEHTFRVIAADMVGNSVEKVFNIAP